MSLSLSHSLSIYRFVSSKLFLTLCAHFINVSLHLNVQRLVHVDTQVFGFEFCDVINMGTFWYIVLNASVHAFIHQYIELRSNTQTHTHLYEMRHTHSYMRMK